MELIKVSKTIFNDSEVNSVNSRDLYVELGLAKGQYSRWIQTNLVEQFLYNDDYIGVRQDVEGNEVISYIVTLDTAKHLCMMSKTENAMKFRKYFIEVEKSIIANSFQIPQTFSEALLLASKQAEQIEHQNKLLLEQKPKVDFYEAVTGSKDTIDMGQVAKVLNKKIGRNKLFEILRDNGVLMSNNVPYQKYCDCGYFRVIESKYTKPDSSTHIGLKTVVYQKGVNYINKIIGEVK